jgi:ribonuclease HI
LIKFNIDGAFTSSGSFAGWGVVARDEERAVILSRARTGDNIHDAFGAELLAISNDVNMAA